MSSAPKKRWRLFLASVGRRPALYPLTTPPIGLLYLAAYVRSRRDLDIRIVDQRLTNCTYEELARQAVAFGADVVGLGAFSSAAYALPLVTRLIREGLPKAFLVLGGPHVSAAEMRALDGNCADAAVAGEGEIVFDSLFQADFDRGNLGHIPGLMWRDASGEIVRNPGLTPLIDDLDMLPMPAYDLIDVQAYWKQQSMPPIPRRRYISMVTSRGCPYHCIWCHKIFGKRHRAHSPERVVAEIEHYRRDYGVDEIEFLDDTFTDDHDRVFEICRLVTQRLGAIAMALPNGIRADAATPDLFAALHDAGLYFCAFPLETGSPRLQEYTGKRLDIPRFLGNLEEAARLGLLTFGFVMLGFPTETEDELQQTIDTACESRLHLATFLTVVPYPNTELYRMVERQHPEKLAGLDYRDATFTYIRVNLTELPDNVLFAYQRRANRRFFLNPRRVARIVRDYPKPHLLPLYLPIFAARVTKGIFG
ncbi:MAG TPA: radical SAM protein [Candidatus Hydrogenedentes bacterium]|nr:radical SAM protein [Candidatus Hydrogenedentota bacterium]